MRLGDGVILAVVACAAAGCGLLGGLDPRCESLCVVTEPSLSGAYDICSPASADLCKQGCAKRIDGQASLCATCLLEKAEFKVPPVSGSADFCQSGQCTKTGRSGSCVYTEGDAAAREACIRQVDPRREVECTADYRPVAECATTCSP